MLHLIPRRTAHVRYFLDDPALELEGVRPGPAGRFIYGAGDATCEADVQRVLRGTSRADVIGYDLIVSAARPISALLAVGTEEQQRALVALHLDGVNEVMEYLQNRALVVRQSEDGRVIEEPSRFGHAVAFTHGVNRAGDPHLHDHILFGSASREFGRVIDRRSLLGHLETADALYHAHLRDGLTRQGLVVWRDFHGREHVSGIDAGLVALWPAHRDRSLPKVTWTRSAVKEHWAAQLPHRLDIPDRAPPPATDVISEHLFAAHFEGRHSIGRRHIVAAFANSVRFGAPAPEIDRVVSRYYPELADQRGVSERTVTQHYARQLDLVRTYGPRPISFEMALQWGQRSRERDVSSRSR